MPKFLEAKLKKEYPNNPHAVYGTMNAIGAMHGNKETKKGAAMEKKHVADHLQTTHTAPDKGNDRHGADHHGHVAGTMPRHKHEGVIHHYTKKG